MFTATSLWSDYGQAALFLAAVFALWCGWLLFERSRQAGSYWPEADERMVHCPNCGWASDNVGGATYACKNYGCAMIFEGVQFYQPRFDGTFQGIDRSGWSKR